MCVNPLGVERDFEGVIDLVRMKACTYTPDGDGKGKEGDIPVNVVKLKPLTNMRAASKDKTVVLKAGKDLTLLAENQLEGPVFASPALVDSSIYLRTDSHLYCFQKPAK